MQPRHQPGARVHKPMRCSRQLRNTTLGPHCRRGAAPEQIGRPEGWVAGEIGLAGGQDGVETLSRLDEWNARIFRICGCVERSLGSRKRVFSPSPFNRASFPRSSSD